ncbi:MAG: hypothetical protein F7C32_03425 [Desulfurococcales archaeon]|nr:hypothetical protein [Desulfurococcales archaeon]
MVRVREAHARMIVGRKSIKGKQYEYRYYTLPLNIYLPKQMVEKWGTEFILILDEDEGTITIKPMKKATKEEIEAIGTGYKNYQPKAN